MKKEPIKQLKARKWTNWMTTPSKISCLVITSKEFKKRVRKQPRKRTKRTRRVIKIKSLMLLNKRSRRLRIEMTIYKLYLRVCR
jgi:hypothetical protein